MGKVSKGCMKLTNASIVTYSSMVLISVIISILQIFDHKNPSIILTKITNAKALQKRHRNDKKKTQ